ncbi:MAG: hypothetical protein CMN30_28645 [Sandaracinus sp.]|nr:hypothetical protein [Sandaracinus sp.]
MSRKPLAIVGAGMSGLSLAVALRRLGRRVDVYEAAAEPPRSRTFCGFEVEDHPFTSAVGHRWNDVVVRGPGETHRRPLVRHPYAMIEGSAFVDRALGLLEGTDVRLHFGAPVADVADLADAAHVFDSRPAPPAPDALLQVFAGRFVRTAEPRFDPGAATLMDFRVDQSRGVHFVYVLPTSRTEALVEDTYFVPGPLAPEVFAETLDAQLAALGDHEVLATEAGTIPMSTAEPPPAPPGVTRIGLAGGVAKASTGYAFLFAQRHAQAIRVALREGRPPPATVRSAQQVFLDQVFLERLRAEPTAGHRLFLRMFERTSGDRLARFLSETASLRDTLAIMRSLPLGPFAWQAVRTGLVPRRP